MTKKFVQIKVQISKIHCFHEFKRCFVISSNIGQNSQYEMQKFFSLRKFRILSAIFSYFCRWRCVAKRLDNHDMRDALRLTREPTHQVARPFLCVYLSDSQAHYNQPYRQVYYVNEKYHQIH